MDDTVGYTDELVLIVVPICARALQTCATREWFYMAICYDVTTCIYYVFGMDDHPLWNQTPAVRSIALQTAHLAVDQPPWCSHPTNDQKNKSLWEHGSTVFMFHCFH